MATPLAHVRIVGTGLLGTSIGLALRARGVTVSLSDPSPTAQGLASDMGAGSVDATGLSPVDLVVVAAPPDVVADVIARELQVYPEATVTDVASVKQSIAKALAVGEGSAAAHERYVGSHPMAGRERSGAVAARSDLFEGRTWVVCADDADRGVPGKETSARSAHVERVVDLAQLCGARVVFMNAQEHDAAVAAVSHVPQIASSLVAAQLRQISDESLALAGQGVRDVTRIAASDPMLWTQILAGNSQAIRPIVDAMVTRLEKVRDALGDGGSRAVLAQAIADGQDGRARIPGKHGSAPTVYSTVAVVIPDEPGALGLVFTAAGQTGVSIEDIRIEHDPGVNAGVLELDVIPMRAQTLCSALIADGWRAHVLDVR